MKTTKTPKTPKTTYKPLGYWRSLHNPRGLYTPSGKLIAQSSCDHIDYPCCGC